MLFRSRVTKLPGLSHADPERIPAVLAVAEVPAPSRAAGLLCGTPGTAARVIELGEATRAAAVDACSQTL